MKRRVVLALTGPALTAPAHQWLAHEPEPLVSGLTGRQVSGELVDRFTGMAAELHIRQALAFATLGDSSAGTTALSQARTQVEQLKPDDDPPWLYWLDPAAVTINVGACLLQLGQAEQAAAMLHEGIAQFSGSFVRDRQVCTTRLADALARPGKQRDLEAAAGLGMQSIELAETLDATRGAGLLRDLYHQLRPHSQVPAVRDFLERARGFAA